jgi:hypothetical protein
VDGRDSAIAWAGKCRLDCFCVFVDLYFYMVFDPDGRWEALIVRQQRMRQ